MSDGRGISSPTSTAMRLPLTTTLPLATGRSLARTVTASSSVASSSMMAPRPSRRTWWIGMVAVPSTTAISTETLFSVAIAFPKRPAQVRAGLRSPWYGEWMVNIRNALKVGLGAPPGSAPVEWRVSDSPVPYEAAVAVMQSRAAAIAAGSERELVWLLEHPPLYTAGTGAKPNELIAARFPVFESGRGGQ